MLYFSNHIFMNKFLNTAIILNRNVYMYLCICALYICDLNICGKINCQKCWNLILSRICIISIVTTYPLTKKTYIIKFPIPCRANGVLGKMIHKCNYKYWQLWTCCIHWSLLLTSNSNILLWLVMPKFLHCSRSSMRLLLTMQM